MATPSFREATADDLDAIDALFSELDEHHVQILPDVFQSQDGPARSCEFVNDIVESPDETFIVAELDGRVVAFAHIGEADMPPAPMFKRHKYALLKNMVVSSTHRGIGIGRQLSDATKRWARDRGLDRMQAIVWTANADAVRYYERAGFEPMTVRLQLELG